MIFAKVCEVGSGWVWLRDFGSGKLVSWFDGVREVERG